MPRTEVAAGFPTGQVLQTTEERANPLQVQQKGNNSGRGEDLPGRQKHNSGGAVFGRVLQSQEAFIRLFAGRVILLNSIHYLKFQNSVYHPINNLDYILRVIYNSLMRKLQVHSLILVILIALAEVAPVAAQAETFNFDTEVSRYSLLYFQSHGYSD